MGVNYPPPFGSLTYLYLLPPISASLEASVTQAQFDISNKWLHICLS